MSLPVSLSLFLRLWDCFSSGPWPFFTVPPDSPSMTLSLTCLYISLSLAANLLLRYFWSAAGTRSLCLCVFSDSGMLRYDFVSLGLRASIPFASSLGLSHPSPAPTRLSASQTGQALFPSSRRPAPPRLGSPPFFVCLGLSPHPFPWVSLWISLSLAARVVGASGPT